MVAVTFAAIGVIAGLGTIAMFPPVRRAFLWAWHRNISCPIGEWFRGIVRDEATGVIKRELKSRNGGNSIPDLGAAVSKLDAKVQRHIDDCSEQFAEHRATTEAARRGYLERRRT